VDTTLISVWQDSAVVRFLTTIHTGKEWVVRERKKPKASSSNPVITRAPFKAFPSTDKHLIAARRSCRSKEYVHRRLLPIPGIVDDYNYFMNGVDIADQLRAKFTVHQRTHQTWLPLFYFCLDTTVVNAYLLPQLLMPTYFLWHIGIRLSLPKRRFVGPTERSVKRW
jgi:hypothetical protein